MFPQGSDLMDCEMGMAAIASEFQIECVYFDYEFTSVMHTSMTSIANNFQTECVCFEQKFDSLMHTSVSYQRDCEDGAIFSRALRGLKSAGVCVCV